MSINGSYVLDFSLQRRHWTATQKIHTLSLSSFNTHFRQSNFTEALLQYLIFQFSVRNLPWLLRYPPKIWFTTVVSLLNLSNLREFKGPCNQMKLVISGVKKTQFSFILKKNNTCTNIDNCIQRTISEYTYFEWPFRMDFCIESTTYLRNSWASSCLPQCMCFAITVRTENSIWGMHSMKKQWLALSFTFDIMRPSYKHKLINGWEFFNLLFNFCNIAWGLMLDPEFS